MSDETPQQEPLHDHENERFSFVREHRFMVLIAGVIALSLFLVFVAMALYNSSGAAQLDLSRPGYDSVRDQVTPTDRMLSFAATGELDDEALEEFRLLYEERSKQAVGVDLFSVEAMSDEALLIDDVSAPGEL